MLIKPTEEMIKNGVKGFFVGGCIKRGEGSSFRARAHAHNCHPNNPLETYYGWVCFRSLKRILKCVALYLPSSSSIWHGELTDTNRIIMHEYVHILTPNHGHDKIWKEKMRSLKQPIPKRYFNGGK